MFFLVLKLSKKHLKANHNLSLAGLTNGPLGFKIVKETFESKSQPKENTLRNNTLGFKIVKETFESKSQHFIGWYNISAAWF